MNSATLNLVASPTKRLKPLKKGDRLKLSPRGATTRSVSGRIEDELAEQGVAVGRVDLIFGPMFAGKSTELLHRVRTERTAGRQVGLVKSCIDNRYTCEHVTTHAGDKLPCITTDRLLPVLDDPLFMGNDVIGIDEAQFFPDLVDFVMIASEMHKKTVVVAGLDGDYKRQKFGQILDLVPWSDTVTKLSGKCHFCSCKSLFSFRVAADDRQELIGGGDKYVPTCRHHYVELARTRVMHT